MQTSYRWASCMGLAKHEIQKAIQIDGGLVWTDAQFLWRLIEPVHPERWIAERFRTGGIPTTKSNEQYVFLLEMQPIHAQPIRARIGFVRVIGVRTNQVVEVSSQARVFGIRTKHRRAEISDRDDACTGFL